MPSVLKTSGVSKKASASRDSSKGISYHIGDLHARVALSKQFIDQNIQSALHLKDMASKAHLSEFHFSRVFKKIYNITPYQYFIKKKVEHAAHLIIKTQLPFTAIAYSLGFKDIHSFSKTFKKIYHTSPTEYRRKKTIHPGQS